MQFVDLDVLIRKHSWRHQALRAAVRARPSLFWHYLMIFGSFLLCRLHIIGQGKYEQIFWRFLAKQAVPERFYQRAHVRLVKALADNVNVTSNALVVAQIPQFILDKLLTSTTLTGAGLAISEAGVYLAAGYTTPGERIKSRQATNGLATPNHYRRYFRRAAQRQDLRVNVVDRDHYYQSWTQYLWASFGQMLIALGFIFVVSVILGGATTLLASYGYNALMTRAVLNSVKLLLVNSAPIFLLSVLCFFIFNNIGWALFLGFLPFGGLSLANYFMIKYRSFPLKFSDLALAKEAGNMGERYSYWPSPKIIAMLVALIVLCFLGNLVIRNYQQGRIRRLLGVILTLLVGWGLFNRYYSNDTFYKATPIVYGNVWNEANRFATNGFTFSFLHSIKDRGLAQPANYSAAKAKQDLAQYSYHNIPKKKRINVIMIQLEAYNDFSKFKNIEIDPSVYAGLRQIQAESLHGNLTTAIFGGGTVDTERKAVTGYSELAAINQNINSFVRYFNEQDYQTLALHPGYGWFYNRQNIEKYLGFDRFYYKENYYNKNVSKSFIVPDKKVFADLHNQFDKTVSAGNQMFNQTITYQNHGPYATEFSGTPVVKWQTTYNKEDYAIINNYLTGIKQTNEALVKLLADFKDDAPTVIAFWGDHNPWGGDNNSTYQMLGIDLDQGTSAGYFNYYNTPYVIWSNTAAKKVLKEDFKGQGPDISPMYLLPTIFEHAGWAGNQYMQVLQKLQPTLPVIGSNRYLYNGKLVESLPQSISNQLATFKNTQYYYETTLNDH